MEHPRPQLTRAHWTSLGGPWSFAEDPGGVGLRERWFESDHAFTEHIIVPFPPESPRSGLGRDVSDVIWYQRAIDLEPPQSGDVRLLHFEAIDYRCSIWVNGIHLADHEGGQTRVSVDATQAWRNTDNVVTVRVVDARRDIEQPRGKQDWSDEPHVIWYRRTSGIWRTVWLEDVPEMRVESLTWTTGTAFGQVELEATLAGDVTDGQRLDVTIRSGQRVLAQTAHEVLSERVRVQLFLDDPSTEPEPENLWWSPEHPHLLDVSIVLHTPGGRTDDVGSYFGLRTVGVDDRSFLLNNRPYFLRLVLEQGYWPDTHLASPSDADLRREVELIKELGFNGIRMHQVVADPRFLYWCDRLGLVVWADAAASYRFSSRSFGRTTREWLEIVDRDRNHPSIVAWVAFNESWGVPAIATDPRQRAAALAMYHLLSAADGSRVVIANDGWEFVGGDIAGIHDYSHAPGALEERYAGLDRLRRTLRIGRTGGRRLSLVNDEGSGPVPVVLSEFGGVNLTDAAETWDGYGRAGSAEELLAALRGLFRAIGQGSGLAGFCYTQLTDTLQERNGLLTERREHKADPILVAAIVEGASP